MIVTLRSINRTILSKKHKVMLSLLLVLNIIGAAFEAASLYLFVPILEYFKSPDTYDAKIYLWSILSDFVNIFGHQGLGTFVLITLVFFIKALLMSFFSYTKNNIVSTIRQDLSILVFSHSIFQNYRSLLKTKTSVLMNNLTASISHFTNGILFTSINIVSEILVIVSISLVLVINTSLITMIVPFIVGILGIIILRLFRSWAVKVGNIRQRSEAGRVQVLKESFASILEIKIYKAEHYFLKQFQNYEINLRKAGIGILTMAETPKYILELLGVLTIFGFFLLSYSLENMDNILTTNGLFAIAIIKLMPSFNRIVVAVNSIKSAIPAYNDVSQVFANSVKNKIDEESQKSIRSSDKISILKISNLSYQYKREDNPIINDFTVSLEKGNIYGLIGPSGSGKTTLLNLISGVYESTNSETKHFIDGKLICNFNEIISDYIGYVPQSPQLFNRSIAENITFDHTPTKESENRILKALIDSKAADFVNNLEGGIHHVLSDFGMNLSGGQRQRLALARVLYREPSLIILDEATNALDQKTVDDFMNTIKAISASKIVIIVSHSDEMISYCNQIITIKK